ncbi:MAG: DUF2815 domain-containing protein [Clostridiales bacterium]|nr:DUF2815 domain-containing protein [Clostridiales bacterium]
MTTSNNNASATIITGRRTRLSYAQLFEPKGFDGQKPMYSVSLIIPKDDKKTLDMINAAIKAAYENGSYKLRGNGKSAPALEDINLPLNDGDKKRPNDPAYANSYYINAKNSEQPKLFGMDGEEVMSRSELYSGCYARCKVTFYAYNRNGNRGIGVSLQGLRKVADGKPLGGSICTADDFDVDEEYEDEDDFLS